MTKPNFQVILDTLNTIGATTPDRAASVIAITETAGYSESRTRELLNEMLNAGLVHRVKENRSVKFHLPVPVEADPLDTTPSRKERALKNKVEAAERKLAAEKAKAHLAAGECPLCGADPSSQTAASQNETLWNTCHRCGHDYHSITGKQRGERKSNRDGNLNPQPVIDRKRAAVEEAGGKLVYEKHERLWAVVRADGTNATLFNSRQFACYTAEDLVEFLR